MIDVSAKMMQARQHFEAGRHEQAKELLTRALRQSPGHPDLSNALGMVLAEMGQLDLAVYHAERAAKARPQESGYWSNLGNALGRAGRAAEARTAFEKAVELSPRAPEPRLGLSHVLRVMVEFSRAAEHLKVAAEASPGDPDIAANLSLLLLKLARVEEAVAVAREGVARNPGHLALAAALAHASNYTPGMGAGEILAAHAAYGRILEAMNPVRGGEFRNLKEPERKIKIGLLSYDLRMHPVGMFVEPVLAHRDRTRVEMVCYSTCAVEDAHSARLKGLADGWKRVGELGDAQIADVIRADGVDVLIELAGLTSSHRLGVMAMRPAPVQGTFCGYPSTTGLSRIGFRMVDSMTDPVAIGGSATEELVRLDPSFLCYVPPAEAPEAGRAPVAQSSDRRHGVTFGSFNSGPKINRGVVEAWARVLREVPGSRLLLKALEFKDGPMREELVGRFVAAGIEAERVEVIAQTSSFAEHLGLYGRVDVALDPFPYNGTTTTFEALWMGVPVVTLEGQTHAGRVGMSILKNAGLGELIAGSGDQYVAKAAELARDGARRAEMRRSLRERVRGSVLCDGTAYGRRFDEAVRGMWRAWCRDRT